jgi:hypothetical protein
MTGPEHYTQAEELLGFTENVERGTQTETSLLAEAQVHATLALAAAVAASGGLVTDGTMGPTAWARAAGGAP